MRQMAIFSIPYTYADECGNEPELLISNICHRDRTSSWCHQIWSLLQPTWVVCRTLPHWNCTFAKVHPKMRSTHSFRLSMVSIEMVMNHFRTIWMGPCCLPTTRLSQLIDSRMHLKLIVTIHNLFCFLVYRSPPFHFNPCNLTRSPPVQWLSMQ